MHKTTIVNSRTGEKREVELNEETTDDLVVDSITKNSKTISKANALMRKIFDDKFLLKTEEVLLEFEAEIKKLILVSYRKDKERVAIVLKRLEVIVVEKIPSMIDCFIEMANRPDKKDQGEV